MKIIEIIKLPEGRRLEFKEARQSDIRNKIIAPVFKKLGVIDQWGNGLKMIFDELIEYPEIEFRWFEKGLQFQVQFIKKDYQQQELQQEQQDVQQELQQEQQDSKPDLQPNMQPQSQLESQLELQQELQQELQDSQPYL